MTGFAAFLGKEGLEIVRTWRIWVIPGLLLFFAVTSPILALVTPQLLTSLAGSQPGVIFELPDPTGLDAYGQFLKSLSQIVIIAIIITGAGTISGERSTGTAILVLTKPLSRTAFVLAKLISNLTLLISFTTVATAVCYLGTRLLFPAVSAWPLVHAVALWLVNAGLLVSAMTCFSAVFRSRGAAAGAGLGFLFLTLVLSVWPTATRHTFVGLPGAAGGALASQPVTVGWPVVTALFAAATFAVIAVQAFRQQEL